MGRLIMSCTPVEFQEVILHAVVYRGASAAQEVFRAALEVLEEWHTSSG